MHTSRLTSLTHIENSDFVIDSLRDLGVQVSPCSRLMRMREVLSKGKISPGDKDFRIALQAMRDMVEIGFALQVLGNLSKDEPFLDVLVNLTRDSALPQDGGENTHGRDFQFHLYIAGVLQNAGMAFVSFDEPDVRFVFGGTQYGVAVKRIKTSSKKNLRSRITTGASQILRSGLPGIIAMDMSLAWNPFNRPSISPLESKLFEMKSRSRYSQLERYLRTSKQTDLDKQLKDCGVMSIIVGDFEFAVLDGKWVHQGCLHSYCPHRDSDRKKETERTFIDQLMSGFQ